MDAIDKILHCIWIGDESKMPDIWIKTWMDNHANWEYRIWGNKEFKSYKWKNKELIDSYLQELRYPAVADIMRYQILYDFGGFVHPADSVCLHPIDELFISGYQCYGVYENEKQRPGLISPLYASAKGSDFALELVEGLPVVAPKTTGGKNKVPWQVTGNLYMKKMYEKTNADIFILPSHTFTPIHYTGEIYQGSDKVYAVQMWGTTSKWNGKNIDYLDMWTNRNL